MKKQSIILLTYCILHGQLANASPIAPFFEQAKTVSPKFIYSYIDFDFDSTAASNFNRYQGISNTYTAGGDKTFSRYKTTAGIFVINTETDFNSQFSLDPAVINNAYSTINNTTVFAHIRKTLVDPFDIDIAGGYGRSRVSSQAWVNSAMNASVFSNPNNTNWFVGLNLHYYKNWQKFTLRANVGALYSEVDTDAYLLHNSVVHVVAPQFKNSTTYISENAELGYNLTSEITPFFNAGLIQVAGFKNTPETQVVPVTGFLPQLNMDKDGFRLGAGFSYSRKNFSIRLEEKYYNAGDTFTSYQTIAALSYRFS